MININVINSSSQMKHSVSSMNKLVNQDNKFLVNKEEIKTKFTPDHKKQKTKLCKSGEQKINEIIALYKNELKQSVN